MRKLEMNELRAVEAGDFKLPDFKGIISGIFDKLFGSNDEDGLFGLETKGITIDVFDLFNVPQGLQKFFNAIGFSGKFLISPISVTSSNNR